MNTATPNKSDRLRVLPRDFRSVFIVVSALVLLVLV